MTETYIEWRRKQAGLMQAVQTMASDPHTYLNGAKHLAEAGLWAAGGHVAANTITLAKNKIPGVEKALTRAGVRAGLSGKRLNPAIETATNNILGPEFLGTGYNVAHWRASQALQEAGGDKVKAFAKLRENLDDPKMKLYNEHFEPVAKARAVIKGLPENFAQQKPLPILSTKHDAKAPHNKALAGVGHAASVVGAAAVEPGSLGSVAWNAFKHQLVNNPKLREAPKVQKHFDTVKTMGDDFADGVTQGPRSRFAQAARKLLLSPESEAARNYGHAVSKVMDKGEEAPVVAGIRVDHALKQHLSTPEGKQHAGLMMDAAMGGKAWEKVKESPDMLSHPAISALKNHPAMDALKEHADIDLDAFRRPLHQDA